MKKLGIGVIGCGVISKAYMTAMKQFDHIELRAVADMRSEPAEQRAKEFGVAGMRVDQMLKRDDIDIIVNLTVPLAHTDVSLAVLRAGKHVHSEKPLGVNMVEARKVMELAEEKGLRVGCAPDTFLGGGHQTARKLIDDGAIGTPVYYLRGGGPMLDMGPYYITNLIQLLGPIRSVMGSATRTRSQRLITSEPLNGTVIPVEVSTHVTGQLEFESGAVVSITMSFDVPKHKHTPIEIYGTEGSILVPDPNRFGGEVHLARTGGDWELQPHTHAHTDGEFRSIGVADMASAILHNRPHRASGALALHALEAMEAFQISSDEGRRVFLETTVERPAMLPSGKKNGHLD